MSHIHDIGKKLADETSQRLDEIGHQITNSVGEALGLEAGGDAASKEIHDVLSNFVSMFRTANPKANDPLAKLDAAERAAVAGAAREVKKEKAADRSMAQQIREEPDDAGLPARSSPMRTREVNERERTKPVRENLPTRDDDAMER